MSQRNRVTEYLNRRGVDGQFLAELLAKGDGNYTEFYIGKRSKRRLIVKPCDDLLAIQRAVRAKFIEQIPVTKYCMGYESGTSIRANAAVHRKSRHILHMDIENFFPSVNRQLFAGTFSKKFNEYEMETLWRICSYKGGLPVGGACSPFIANRVLYAADLNIKKLSFFFKYTRYADDIVISSRKYMANSVVSDVEEILAAYGLKVNKEKTYFMESRRAVTGIKITDKNTLTLGTAYKKALKSEIYELLIHNEGDVRKTAGKLAYMNSIEPSYANVLYRKYGYSDDKGLFARAGM